MNQRTESLRHCSTLAPGLASFLDQARSQSKPGPRTKVLPIPDDDHSAVNLDCKEEDFVGSHEWRQRLLANPPIGALVAPCGRFIFVGDLHESIGVLSLRLALGFEGSDEEFMQLVDQTERNCLRINAEACVAMVPFRVARKIAMGLRGAQAACVAYQLAEVMSGGNTIHLSDASGLLITGNPYCPVFEPDLLEPTSRAVHWFLDTDARYDSWWLRRRKKLGPAYRRLPADDDVELPLSEALWLLASERTDRGRRVRDYLGDGPGWDECPATQDYREYWFRVLNDVAGADISRAPITRKRDETLDDMEDWESSKTAQALELATLRTLMSQ
jgi:hypothetical protein